MRTAFCAEVRTYVTQLLYQSLHWQEAKHYTFQYEHTERALNSDQTQYANASWLACLGLLNALLPA